MCCPCCETIKKIGYGRWILGGFIIMVIATIVHMIESVLTMNYYVMPEYFGVWSRIMMPTAGPPPTSFYILSMLFSFFTGLVMFALYRLMMDVLPKKPMKRVCCFTGWFFALSVVLFTFPSILLIRLPVVLTISWLFSSLFFTFCASLAIEKILKRR